MEERTATYRLSATAHLRRYLQILEYQHAAIEDGNTDALEFYLEESKEVLAALHAVQRVRAADNDDLLDEDLMSRVRTQHRVNRDLLSRRRDDLGRQISELRVPPRARSVFQPASHGGNMIDMSM